MDLSETPGRDGASLANWRNAPVSQWTFQNVPEIIPVAPIAATPGDVQRLRLAPRLMDGFRLATHGGGSLDLEQFLDATATDGLVILLDGAIVHETYAHGMTDRTQHILMSASKSVVGLMVGILSDQGVLDLEAPVSTILPEVAATAYRDATLRQLLDMRAGVVLNPADQAIYDAATGWQPAEAGAGLHDFYPSMTTPDAPHGGPFRYISANTDLLGWAIERAAGKTFADLVSEHLWGPMGAQDDAYVTLDPAGAPRCTGGIGATTRDLARLGDLMIRDGRRGERQIIPAAWIDDIATDGDRQAWKDGEFAAGFGGLTMSYRGGWYVIEDEPRTLFAMGIHGQNLFVDRANKLVVAKLSSQGPPIDFRAVGLTHQAVPEIRRCLLG